MILPKHPEPKRSIAWRFRPLVVLSIGLHALLLRVPMPDVEKAEVVEPDEPEVIEVVKLPEVASLPAAADIEAPPAVTPAPPPQPVTPPPVQPQPGVAPAPVIETPVAETPAPEEQIDPETEPETETEPEPETAPEPEIEPETAPEPPTLVQRLADPEEYVSYAKTATEENAYRRASTDWYGEVFMAHSLIPGKHNPDPPIVLDAPLCPTPLPATEVEVGVVVNADGGLEGEPVTLRSTGYDVLNEQVLVLAKEQAYPATGAIAAYEVKVLVTVDCN